MRPKLLEIEGLQSFTEKQRIDFEALSENGLFGIFGPTGSGKSTILDAITFALYGRVKRAENGTQGIINSGCNIVRVAFTFDLLVNGKRNTYRVERTSQRKKNSPNACEPKVARLIQITDKGEMPLCDKAMEVTSHIKELLGLNNEDFTRAVVLPQNSFQEFLMLDNKSRRGMLERIFYLEEYGKDLQDKLSRKIAKVKSSLDILSGQLMGYADASDEALEEASNVLEEAKAKKDAAEKKLKRLETEYNEAKEIWGLVAELETFISREKQLLEKTEAITEKRLKLERAIKANSLIDQLHKSRELKEKLAQTDKQLAEVVSSIPDAAERLRQAKTELEALKKESLSEQPKLVATKTKLMDALEIKKELKTIDTKLAELSKVIYGIRLDITDKDGRLQSENAVLLELAKKIEESKAKMEPLRTDPVYRQQILEGANLEKEKLAAGTAIKELMAKSTSIADEIKNIEAKRKNKEAEIIDLLKKRDALNEEIDKHQAAKPGDRNKIIKSIDRIHYVKSIYEVLKVRASELTQLMTKLDDQRKELREAERQAKLLEEEKERYRLALAKCRTELDAVVAARDRNAALSLARNLKDGEPCPVCGSLDHPAPASTEACGEVSALERQIETAKSAMEAAEQAYKAADRAAMAGEEHVKSLGKQVSSAEKELETRQQKYEAEREKLPEKLSGLELEQIGLEISNNEKLFAKKLESIDIWETELNKYKESLEALNGKIAAEQLIEAGCAAELKKSRENALQLENEISEVQKRLESLEKEHADFLERYGIESADAELKRLADNDKRLQMLQKDAERLQTENDEKRKQVDRLKEELQGRKAELLQKDAELRGIEAQAEDKRSKLDALAGNIDIEAELVSIAKKLEQYGTLEKQYQDRCSVLEKELNELTSRKALLENQSAIYRDDLKSIDATLIEAVRANGFNSESEVEESVIPPELCNELKTGIDSFDTALNNIKAQKELLQKKLGSRSITEEEWLCVSAEYTQTVELKEESISAYSIAKSAFDNITKKHDKWEELNCSYTKLSHKLGLLEQIQKLLKADPRKDNSFIDYIAEDRLRYIAARASQTLGQITKYRYGLELDVEAGFIVVDNANGGVHRHVKSLSGGETFLTSLALALALSEQIQLKGQSPLEFFFLDEGFGTLDQELLDTVIDALERLSSSERVIGLISHVPELKCRIGRRLIVEPPAFDSRGSRVRIEKA